MQYTALAATLIFQCYARALLRGAKLTEEIPLKVHSLESFDPLYTVKLVFDGETVNSIVDTGSTGLIVAKKNAARKQKTCSDESKQCAFQTTWRFTFLTCYADGTGYFVNPIEREVQFGKLATKIMIGSAIGVFDPDRSMLSNDEQVFVSILGCGGHGNSDCAFSSSDAIAQIIEKNSLQNIWSLRSLTATLEGRMYIGASPQIFSSSAKQQYTSLNQYKGKYIVVVSGFLIAGTGRRSSPAKQGLSPMEIILDTGSAMTFIIDSTAMNAILNTLGSLCTSKWTSSPSPNYSSYMQHTCKPAAKWDAHTVTFLFNDGAQTPPLPVTNFFQLRKVNGETILQLQIQSLKSDISPKSHNNIFGKQFFANQWVEFDKTKLRVGFSSSTSSKDQWGPFTECSCFQPGENSLGIKTRACIDRDADGKWCVGQSQMQCKAKPCTTTTTNAVGVWSSWSTCSSKCGKGKQTRTCTATSPSLHCNGVSERSCLVKECCPKTCHVCGVSRSCDEIRAINLALGKPKNSKLCLELQLGGCDCTGCKACTAAVTSCEQNGLLLGDLPGDCNCPEHTSGTPTWNGVGWDPATCIAKFCPALSVDYGGIIAYTDPEGALLRKRQYGSVASISCPKGYLISGSLFRVCVDGVWDGETQNCYPVFQPKSIHEIYNGVQLCFVQKFSDCPKGPPYGPIQTWDVSQVRVMSGLFNSERYVNDQDRLLHHFSDFDYFRGIDGVEKGNVSMWNVSMVADMREMFSNTRNFNGDISKWDVSRVDEMRSMFSNTGAFNADISKWDVSKVTDMERMFENADKFNADISKWDVSKVTSMERMFRSAYAFSRTLCGYWRTSKARQDQMLYRSKGTICSSTEEIDRK